jgi:spermidine synthase
MIWQKLTIYSYQEMITHLAMNSHPNPKKVLVIGGGDGGVLREVVKHETVEEATLVDIDEVRLVLTLFGKHKPDIAQAVIRLSKKYLRGMAVGFEHPNVKVHVEDGFKFLADRKNEFDVIITDSSDPEGPAQALFEKSYFALLSGALREGGVITTQGCKPPPTPSTVDIFLSNSRAAAIITHLRHKGGGNLTFPTNLL